MTRLSDDVLKEIITVGSNWYLEPHQSQTMARELLELRHQRSHLVNHLVTHDAPIIISLRERLAAAERVVEWARMVDKGNHYRNEITVALEAYYKVVKHET